MPDLVIIPTAGIGSRMGDLTKNLNKSLLLYEEKPAISHIIDAFHEKSRFLIPIGYKAEQVKDFLNLAYPTHDISFVQIDDFTSEKSGTAATLLKCVPFIDQEFWYVSCDTIFQKSDIMSSGLDDPDDICWVGNVGYDDSDRYTMFKVIDDRISNISFKKRKDDSWVAFTGLMKINDHQRFIRNLESTGSTEFIHSIEKGTKVCRLPSWTDIGTEELYRNVCKRKGFDFSKIGEQTWVCNNTVVKWWEDPSVSIKKIIKAEDNLPALPKNIKSSGNMIAYDLEPGSTMYKNLTSENLANMLEWLDSVVWKKSDINITDACLSFYKDKTNKRIETIINDESRYPVVKKINGRLVKSPAKYHEMIEWSLLSKTNKASWIHGDLQFDNVIIGDTGSFTAIDWRHEFGNMVTVGDAYYDLAKLLGGCIIDYSRIKSGKFSVKMDNDSVIIGYPSVENSNQFIKMILDFATSKGFNLEKILMLVPIIFWNMAPLHAKPFDLLLWYLGTLKFSEIFDREKIH